MAGTPIKIGLIGTGHIADSQHAPALKRCRDNGYALEFAAVCDVDLIKAQAFAAKHGWRNAYADVAQMLDAERLDAVYIMVPPAFAESVFSAVIPHGIPVFLEKPPAPDSAALERMIALAEQHGTPVFVAFNRRHMPLRKHLQEALATCEAHGCGPMETADYMLSRISRHDAEFHTTAVHAIDTLPQLAGSAYASMVIARWQPKDGGCRYRLTGTLANGAAFSVNARPRGTDTCEWLELGYRDATIRYEMPAPGKAAFAGRVTLTVKREVVLDVFGDSLMEASASDWHNGFAGESAYFLDGVQTIRDQPDVVFVENDLPSARQTIAAMQGLRDGERAIYF